jgi:arylsulfatase A-like enzyme
VSQLDAKVGALVDALVRTGQREDTLVVFTSDNGGVESLKNAYVGAVGHSPLNSENHPLRGEKATLYEGGTRVCAFANWPGKLKPGKLSAPIHAVDWFPTVAAVTGYAPAVDLNWDGMNQWPALSGAGSAPDDRAIYIAARSGQSLHQGDWKLIRSSKGTELFRITEDPFEKRECSALHPEVVARMSQLIEAERAKDQATLPADLVGHHP